ncbi:MAG: hypothetical protein AAF664_11235 [Planctomycetota bacterium]
MKTCCSITRDLFTSRGLFAGISLLLGGGVLALTAFALGLTWAEKSSQPTSIVAGYELPIAHAQTAVSGEKFSMATAPVSEQADGLVVLDHNSGLLQVNVIYPRLADFRASFSVNVTETMAEGKGGSYMLVTGRADFPRSSSQPAASTVIYVMDTATGAYGCYGIPFNRSAMNANQPQAGALVLIAKGSANPIIDRDDLR